MLPVPEVFGHGDDRRIPQPNSVMERTKASQETSCALCPDCGITALSLNTIKGPQGNKKRRRGPSNPYMSLCSEKRTQMASVDLQSILHAQLGTQNMGILTWLGFLSTQDSAVQLTGLEMQCLYPQSHRKKKKDRGGAARTRPPSPAAPGRRSPRASADWSPAPGHPAHRRPFLPTPPRPTARRPDFTNAAVFAEEIEGQLRYWTCMTQDPPTA